MLEDATGTKSDQRRLPPQPNLNDLTETVRTAIDMLATAAAERSIGLSLLAPNAPVVADVDRRALLQVLINLLTNAVKFSPRGAEVRIEIATREDGVEISVRDHGFGMGPNDLAHIGRPFARGGEAVRRHIEGSGLGLSISQRLAEEMHGGLTFDSVLGAGTTARLRLPSVRPEPTEEDWFDAAEPIRHRA